MMQALRVSLGCLGIFTRITLKAIPAFQLHLRQYCAGTEDCLGRLDELMLANRNFCFYWYPRRDDVSIRIWNAISQIRLPVHLGRKYAMVVQSDMPLVVQFSRMHTGQAPLAGDTTMAYAGEV